jgi:DNA-binding NarL/FixJ family response regulator
MIQQEISVIIADDHEIVRDGLATIFSKEKNIRLLAEASNGQQLLQLLNVHNPDIILMDIKMPVMNGIEATRIISKKHPEIGIIALSMYDDSHQVGEMLASGASGYLVKNARKKDLLEAIVAVSKNKTYFCRSTERKAASYLANKDAPSENRTTLVKFSEIEKAILIGICEQLSTKQIAKQLHLSQRTIEKRRERMMQKTNSQNLAGLVVYAMTNHIYDPRQN